MEKRYTNRMLIELPEQCTQGAIENLWRKNLKAVKGLKAADSLSLDADRVQFLDGTGEAFVIALYRASAKQGFAVQCRDAQGVVARTLEQFDPARFAESSPDQFVRKRGTKLLVQLGESAVGLWNDVVDEFAHFGATVVALLRLLFAPHRLRWRDFWLNFERAGIDALPITMLVGFLIGLILAFMSAASLKQFGVEIYVADLICIGLFRELGPIITGIILTGRSGSAFAAELGTMKVNEEIDALTTFGLSPTEFLTLPRVLAATFVMPTLTIFSILAGLVGGAFVLLSMDIPAVAYCQHIAGSLSLNNALFGLGKSMVFGFLIGQVGCTQGLRTGRTADAVGRAATASVVGSLVLITIFDGGFAVLAYFMGI